MNIIHCIDISISSIKINLKCLTSKEFQLKMVLKLILVSVHIFQMLNYVVVIITNFLSHNFVNFLHLFVAIKSCETTEL